MTTNLECLISELPEIYQTIFGHEKWNDASSRDCNIRLAQISEQYIKLEKELQRPLRVLDLGCAQGFFSLSLAKLGATVRGIDFLPANIKVCQALADENPELNVTFEVGRIEDIIIEAKTNDYDLVIGLSVFHHIVHEHGLEQVKHWLKHLADCTEIIIMELALREEPLYWGNSLPENPADLIDYCAFYRLIGEFETHLSTINRPMYVISNKRLVLESFTGTFDSWRMTPHFETDQISHEGTRRYYFGDTFMCKVFLFPKNQGIETFQGKRNRDELLYETNFLENHPDNFIAPKLIESKINKHDGWLMMDRIQGPLVSEMLSQQASIDIDTILTDILSQLVILEQAGLYHDDIRTWNIIFDENNAKFSLIDYGSISSKKQDCGWPYNIILSFFIFVNELLQHVTNKKVIWRKGYITPFLLPEIYKNWLGALWQKPASSWSFSLLLELFEARKTLPPVSSEISGLETWIMAYENLAFDLQNDEIIISNRISHLEFSISSLTRLVNKIESCLQEWDLTHNNEITALKETMSGFQEDISRQQTDISHLVVKTQSLESENKTLHAHQLAMINSRSWKITKPYRYIGLQINLLKQYGVKQRLKHLIKRMMGIAVTLMKNNPVLKKGILTTLNKTGLYTVVYRIYRRAFPIPIYSGVMQNDCDERIHTQIDNIDLLPRDVKEIYHMLTKNN